MDAMTGFLVACKYYTSANETIWKRELKSKSMQKAIFISNKENKKLTAKKSTSNRDAIGSKIFTRFASFFNMNMFWYLLVARARIQSWILFIIDNRAQSERERESNEIDYNVARVRNQMPIEWNSKYDTPNEYDTGGRPKQTAYGVIIALSISIKPC